MRSAYSVRGRNVLVALVALAAVAQLGCNTKSSSKDAGHDGGNGDVGGDHAGAGEHPDAKNNDKPVCNADAGAKVVNGEACGCNGDCQSGFCVDGVCCDGACTDTCKACNVQGNMGTCTFVPAGLAPRAAPVPICPKSDVGTCGGDGMCDGQGACRKYVRGTVCKGGMCDGAAVTNIQTCDGAGTCGPGDAKVCVPFSCDTNKQDCFSACTTNADCAPGVLCMSGSCGLKMNSASCAKNEECGSGFCVDGVCCAVACQGACVSCNQVGRAGVCWPIDQGVPDPRKVCQDSGAAKCGQTGTCDGFGACAKYARETVCVLPSCAGTRLNTPGTCDGQGTCQPPGVNDCQPYACSMGACNTKCDTNADCGPGIACVANSCGKFTNGGTCTSASQCASGFCVDGVCCNEACGGACRSCALSSARGTCTPIPANTVDNRKVCQDQGAGSCGTNGRCDGAGGCAKYANGTVCGAEKCVSNVYTGVPTCNAGQCVAPASRACLPFACNGTKCFDACTTSTNCVSPNVCNGNSCGKKLPGAPCSAATECASAVCAQGFCCATSCNAACKSCGLPGTEGACTNVATGAIDPKAMCVDQGAASCGTNGRCAAGACQKYAANTKCKDPTCPVGTINFTGQSVCDGAGVCKTPATTQCFPFACGAAAACNGTCKSNADCAPNATCINGSCGLQPKGGPCSASSQCSMGLVCSVQGVCCDKLCDGACVSCKLSATLGTCSPVALGATDPSSKCGMSNQSTCGNDGTCDGVGGCHKWKASTQCAPPTCPAMMASGTNATTCDGIGNCNQGGGPNNCSPFMCNPTTAMCLGTCTSNNDCVPPFTCVGNSCGKKPAGAMCVSSDQCTAGLFCTDGVCCTVSACGMCKACGAMGLCQNADGNACTTADMCHVSTGTCSGGSCSSASVNCDDNNPCTSDSCSPTAGCQNTPVPNGTGSCSDGKNCTSGDTCVNGVCKGTVVSCPGGTICSNPQGCDPADGKCKGSPFPPGTVCMDGNKCQMNQTCMSDGSCSGDQVNCDDMNPCTQDSCNPTTGCVNTPIGGACGGSNKCVMNQTCQNGMCSAGTAVDCNDHNDCTQDSCNPTTGCVNTPIGGTCGGGNKCVMNQTCQNGMCSAGTAVDCNDHNDCTQDSCNPTTGCVNTPLTGPSCDAGITCTINDSCVSGLCVPGTPMCPDGQMCDLDLKMCVPII
jgi:hypothetical protein